MPIYDFRCSKCGVVEERIRKISEMDTQRCNECHSPMGVIISHSTPSVHKFPEGYWDNIIPPHSPDYPGEQGVYVKNKRQLRELCRKHQTGSVYLEDL